jgi:hypothetical protein
VPAKKTKTTPVTATDDDHHKPGDYWTGPDCAGDWYVNVVTDDMGPVTWKSKEAAGPFKTEAEAQAWIVEEDRKTCIALGQKALDAERELADFKATDAKARREKREEKIGQDNHRNILLMNSAASIQSADYHGPIDDEIVAACRRTAQAWNELANKLANKLAATSVSGNDVDPDASAAAAKAAHAAADDGLDIPPHLRRTGIEPHA